MLGWSRIPIATFSVDCRNHSKHR